MSFAESFKACPQAVTGDEVRAEWKVSIRRACSALRARRSTYHYRHRRAGQAGLKKRIKEIAETRMRYGYRRIHVLLQREGWGVNAKRVYRLYREMALQLRNKTPKRRVRAKLREDRRAATHFNDVWAMDFVHDQTYDGDRLRILTVYLMHANGVDLRRRPREERKARLSRLVNVPGLELVEEFPDGVELLAAAEHLRLEGVSKRRDGVVSVRSVSALGEGEDARLG